MKRGADVGNIVLEVSVKVRDYLVNNGRMYVEWSAFKVRSFENVFRCFGCYGYGHTIRECKIGKVCRRCGDKNHLMRDCKRDECCINCKMKNLPSGHSVLFVLCPEYVCIFERRRERISND